MVLLAGHAAPAATLLADTDKGKGSPIGFFVILVLVIAVYFLYRSLSKHINRVPASFDPPDGSAVAPPEPAPTTEPEPGTDGTPLSP
jgi:hypothetical protein